MESNRNKAAGAWDESQQDKGVSEVQGILLDEQTEKPKQSVVVPIKQAVATQIRNRIEHLAVSREAWELGAYARSNEILYSLIADCYTLYKELTDKTSPTTKDKRRGLDDYISLKGMVFKDDTPLTGKIIRCVRGDRSPSYVNVSHGLACGRGPGLATE